MINLFDIMDEKLYKEMLDEKFIRTQSHPTLDLSIVNYTEKTQFDNVWNEVTKQCRGLIVNSDKTVIARPFPKFMNYGQNQADIFLMDEPVEVTDKMDGSLGILWNYQGEQGIATRGSFTSDQAIHATSLWKRDWGFRVSPDWTYLFEIIYPQNRIVLNYGDRDELVLLGVMDIEEGYVLPPKHCYTWRGPKTTSFPYKTLREALEAPPRANAEGFVVWFPELDYRMKIKQEDYVLLHRIVTGLTDRRIWESMKEGKTLQELCEIVPDEWHDWLRKTHQTILDAYWDIHNYISAQFNAAMLHFQGEVTRKDFALYVKDGLYAGFMFMLFDGKDISDKVWDLVRPSADPV